MGTANAGRNPTRQDGGMETLRRLSDSPPNGRARVLEEPSDLTRRPVAEDQPTDILQRLLEAAAAMAQVGWGVSAVAPAKGDARFTDPAWRENPIYRRLVQAYLIWAQACDEIAAAAAPDWRARGLQ